MVTKDDLEFIRECDFKKAMILEYVKDVLTKLDCESSRRYVSKEAFDKVREHSDRIIEQFECYAADMIKENEARKQRILKEISALPSVELDVIRMRYQKGWNWQRIVEEMHYSDTNVFRIHRRALERLAEETETI